MKVAFLFDELHPNYQHTFQVIDAFTPAERASVECRIATGLWGLCDPKCRVGVDDREGIVARLFLNRAGSVTAFRSPKSIQLLASANVFVVLFSSLRRDLVRRLHDRLLDRAPRYHGFIQVLPQAPGHVELFSWLAPSVDVAASRIRVLHRGEDDEFVADEMLEWVRDKHGWLITATVKEDVGLQDTIFDANSGSDQVLDRAVSLLDDEWQTWCESTLARLRAVAPDACGELLSAVNVLAGLDLDAAACRQVSVNLRRCMEMLADVLAPAKSAKKAERFQDRLREYINERLKTTDKYAAYLHAELAEFETRMLTLWKLLDKGVHEDWMQAALRPLVLRIILLIKELLVPVKPCASRVVLEDALFD